MKKQIQDAGAYINTTFSFASLKARTFRIVGTLLAYMVGTGQITTDMTWGTFIAAFSSPIHVVGMLGVLLVAGSTAGGAK